MSTRPQLDKGHGFMKFIVNNQIDRDNYEKEQALLQKKRKEETEPGKPKRKKERALYQPPHRRSYEKGSSSSTDVLGQNDNGQNESSEVVISDTVSPGSKRKIILVAKQDGSV